MVISIGVQIDVQRGAGVCGMAYASIQKGTTHRDAPEGTDYCSRHQHADAHSSNDCGSVVDLPTFLLQIIDEFHGNLAKHIVRELCTERVTVIHAEPLFAATSTLHIRHASLAGYIPCNHHTFSCKTCGRTQLSTEAAYARLLVVTQELAATSFASFPCAHSPPERVGGQKRTPSWSTRSRTPVSKLPLFAGRRSSRPC